MTVRLNDRRRKYEGDGVTRDFNAPMVYRATDLQLSLIDQTTGVSTEVLPSAYTVDKIGNKNGARVRMNLAPAAGQDLLILQSVPFSQDVDITNQSAFNAETLEQGDDLLAMQIQRIADWAGRSVQLPETYTGDASTILPEPVAGGIPVWNEDANAFEYTTAGEMATGIAYGDKQFQIEAGNGVQTAYTLTTNPGSLGNLDVSINGVTQVNGADFNYSGTTLTFAVAPPNGAVILIRYDLAVPVGTGLASGIFYTPPSTGIFGSVQSFLDQLWSTAANRGAALIRFIQAGVGAVALTVMQKLRQTVHVQDFGAVGDGVTDDTAALTAAILASGGRNLQFGRGPYIISAGLPLNSDYHWYGQATVIRMKSGLGGAIPGTLVNLNFAGSFSNIDIDGITFDSNRANNIDHGVPDGAGNQSSAWVGQHVATAVIANVTGLRIRNCGFINSWGNGVLLNNCKRIHISGCLFDSHRRVALALQNDLTQHAQIVGNHFANTVVGCMVIDGGHDITITGNTAENCSDRQRFPAIGYSGTYPNVWPTTGGFITSSDPGYITPTQTGDGSGIELTGSTALPLLQAYNVAIDGNAVNNCWVGIRVEGQNNAITVTGNVVRACEGPGIFLFSSQKTAVSGNTCQSNAIGIQSIQGPGVPFPQRPRFNSITGNICVDNTQFGIQLGGEANSTVSGNTLSGNGSGVGFQGGLSMVVAQGINCDLNTIGHNSICNNNPVGIGFDGTSHTGNLISHNTINGNTIDGIQRPVAGYPYDSNKVVGNPGQSPSSNFGADNLIAGNTFVDVVHGLPFTPDGGRIVVTPASDTQGKRWWVNTIGASTFRINIDSAAASGITFHWLVPEDK